jgi:hypothetical protein
VTKTNFEEPGWEQQMREMLGPDADDMLGRFSQIIEEHGSDDCPYKIEVGVDESDIANWLPAVHEWLTDDDNEEGVLRDVLWNVGMQLADLYMETDMPGVMELTQIYSYFYPPFEGYEDDESDD